VRKVLVKNPKAGSDSGTGTVFGAGKVDNSGENGGEISPPKKAKKAKEAAAKKKMCLVL
jgi:hypothetical protein